MVRHSGLTLQQDMCPWDSRGRTRKTRRRAKKAKKKIRTWSYLAQSAECFMLECRGHLYQQRLVPQLQVDRVWENSIRWGRTGFSGQGLPLHSLHLPQNSHLVPLDSPLLLLPRPLPQYPQRSPRLIPPHPLASRPPALHSPATAPSSSQVTVQPCQDLDLQPRPPVHLRQYLTKQAIPWKGPRLGLGAV